MTFFESGSRSCTVVSHFLIVVNTQECIICFMFICDAVPIDTSILTLKLIPSVTDVFCGMNRTPRYS
jgi:hypothetical protein